MPRTPNPPDWEEYDGSIYNKRRGYGWLTDLSGSGWDRGGFGEIRLADGRRTSPAELGRLELANGHASHAGNHPVVFRIDLPDGWYRLRCSSVFPGDAPLPLVNERTIKLRARDVVVAGPQFGAPLTVEGNRLIEGSAIVEATGGYLRIVMGDPAYGGWTWSYRGSLWDGWGWWWRHPVVFANNWYQKLTRTVDPGFHGLRLNSLEVERTQSPGRMAAVVFSDFFDRDGSMDINAGLDEADHWNKVLLHPAREDHVAVRLDHTALKLVASTNNKGVVGLLQMRMSPERGTIRYSTRVTLFTGEGSRTHSGAQEAGLLILAEPGSPTEFKSTFIGVVFDRRRRETSGWVKYRVGDGTTAHRTDVEIPDTTLPFRVTEGEYEITVDHDVERSVLSLIQINGADITGHVDSHGRKQRIDRGWFGLRTSMDPLDAGVELRQFYWYYRVERIGRMDGKGMK
jgi:hypothetical protein